MFARCVKQLGFYTKCAGEAPDMGFARCVKQLGFYTEQFNITSTKTFARCVKQLGFYTMYQVLAFSHCLLGVLNN